VLLCGRPNNHRWLEVNDSKNWTVLGSLVKLLTRSDKKTPAIDGQENRNPCLHVWMQILANIIRHCYITLDILYHQDEYLPAIQEQKEIRGQPNDVTERN
jgi:hypothetical protein